MKVTPLRLAAKYLQGAVQFAQLDLSKFSGKELATVERVVQRIIHRGEPATLVAQGALDRRTLAVLQERALELLRSIATPAAKPLTIAGDLLLTFVAVREDDATVSVRVLGSPLDRFQYQLIRLLQEAGVEKLLTCPAHKARPDTGICGRLFLKVTQKNYCSTQCQSRAYMRDYRPPSRREFKRGKKTR
jgi:hypothetical protein